MRKFITLGLLLLAGSIQLLAQNKNGKITGSVLDAANKPLASATVSLLKLEKSQLVKTAISDKDGKYEFINLADGQYIIQVSSAGLEKKTSGTITIDAANTIMQVTRNIFSDLLLFPDLVNAQHVKAVHNA